ncbi:hypothetical protein [Paenibacillus sp. KS-LC4]|uniref:hypothetical protein n=1 Tax=Paenibacillus sp. KS-LC4 TaxID=2979727 RepID=UPI0030D5B415
MAYSDILNRYIKESGFTLSDICQRIGEKGISIDRSYLSKLKTGAKPPASDELSRAIAEVTGGDSEALIIAGYIEKSPEELKKTIEELNNIIYDFLDVIRSKATSSQKLELLTNIKKEIFDNPYIQGLLANLESNDAQDFDYEDRLSILAVYATETFNFRDKLKILVVANLFYIRMMLDTSSSEHSTIIDNTIRERSTSKVATNFASLNDKKEILSEDEAEFLQDCLLAFRKQQEKMKSK